MPRAQSRGFVGPFSSTSVIHLLSFKGDILGVPGRLGRLSASPTTSGFVDFLLALPTVQECREKEQEKKKIMANSPPNLEKFSC